MTECKPGRFNEAVRAGCTAADLHLTCSFPACKCRNTPQIVQGAIDKWEALRTLGEQMSELPAREVEAGKPGQPEGAGNAADLSRDDSGTLEQRMQHVPGCKAAFTKDDADCDLCGRF